MTNQLMETKRKQIVKFVLFSYFTFFQSTLKSIKSMKIHFMLQDFLEEVSRKKLIFIFHFYRKKRKTNLSITSTAAKNNNSKKPKIIKWKLSRKERKNNLFVYPQFFAVLSQIFNQSNNSKGSKNNSIIFFCELYMFFFKPLLIRTNVFNQMRTS